MKILFLTSADILGAASRYRVYQYLDYLKKGGFECKAIPSLFNKYLSPSKKFKKLYHFSKWVGRMAGGNAFILMFFKRLFDIRHTFKSDIIFIQKNLFPFGPPFLEKIIRFLNKKKKIIFDFDDTIYLPPISCQDNKIFMRFWDDNLVSKIISMSDFVIAGNSFLAKYASKYNKNITVIPTAIDTERYDLKDYKKLTDEISIGWIGSSSTNFYLEQLRGVFKELGKKYNNLTLKIIGAKIRMNEIKTISKEWNLDSEVNDLQSFDIGVMPLTDDEWSKGKCGLKILQYMAVGVPAVASPVGVNKEIIQNGINGFLAGTDEEWIEKLSLLIENPELRYKLGMKGRQTVEKNYSVKVNAPKLKAVLKRVYSGG